MMIYRKTEYIHTDSDPDYVPGYVLSSLPLPRRCLPVDTLPLTDQCGGSSGSLGGKTSSLLTSPDSINGF